MISNVAAEPVKSLDKWEDNLLLRYPDLKSIAKEKIPEEYRSYDDPARDIVIMKDCFPEPALYMLGYHSFYLQHLENGYDHLMNDYDREMFKYVGLFDPYDLYSKKTTHHDKNEL